MGFFDFLSYKTLFGVGTAITIGVVGSITLKRLKAKRNDEILNKNDRFRTLLLELKNPSYHIRNENYVKEVLKQIVLDGKDKLQIIADFDRTLTCHSYNGKPCDTTHNSLDESAFLPDSYRKKATALRDHYLPIEFDQTIPQSEKIQHMVQWYRTAHGYLLECNLNRKMISKIVENSKIKLRDNTDWLFKKLDDMRIPLLIFSAGVGDIIDEVLRQQAQIYRNMKIVSNYMEYDKNDVVIGFKEQLIHMFNKNEAAIHKSDYFKTLKNRTNIVLIGDTLGDLKMADGATNCRNLLKIGFINFKVDEHLENYKKSFDIVIVDDNSMNLLNTIIYSLSKNL